MVKGVEGMRGCVVLVVEVWGALRLFETLT